MGITARQFEEMQDRVTVRHRRTPSSAVPVQRPPSTKPGSIILGIDPSLRGTGYGIIRVERPQSVALDHGTIRCPAGWRRSRCLARIASVLREAIQRHHPTICVVEGLFYAQNLQTALIMGEARGASLVPVAEAGLDICEIAPRKVKQAVVGYGAATKLAVAKMVQRMLGLDTMPEPDAADALALALTHAMETGHHQFTPLRRI